MYCQEINISRTGNFLQFIQPQAATINGPEKYPGASHVQLEDGTLLALETLNPAARKALAAQLQPGKKVLRNLQDGDLVLMNRQPTLHKPSMMGHRVRVLTGEDSSHALRQL